MICPTCYGTHLITINNQPTPCPECQGVGTLHCCDGLQCHAIPEAPADDEPDVPTEEENEVYFAS